ERQRELAKAALRRQGLLGGPATHHQKPAAKRSVKFNKGYTALSQTADDSLVSLDSDRWGLGKYPRILGDTHTHTHTHAGGSELAFGSAFFVPCSQQVNQDLSRQLLQDGYHLDEVPDDEDLDLIPPKPVSSSSCPCCFGENLCCVIQ
ncbi:Protein FAM219B, partial [Dryobates pubescens]